LHRFQTVSIVQIEDAEHQITTDRVVDVEAAFDAGRIRRRRTFKQFEFQIVVFDSRLVGAGARKGLLNSFTAVTVLDVITFTTSDVSQTFDIAVRLTPAESNEKMLKVVLIEFLIHFRLTQRRR
jgi:hypothetical protein